MQLFLACRSGCCHSDLSGQACELHAGMAAEELSLHDVAARGVLAAFDEASVILTRSGGNYMGEERKLGAAPELFCLVHDNPRDCDSRRPMTGEGREWKGDEECAEERECVGVRERQACSCRKLFRALLDEWEAEPPSGLLSIYSHQVLGHLVGSAASMMHRSCTNMSRRPSFLSLIHQMRQLYKEAYAAAGYRLHSERTLTSEHVTLPR